MPQPSGLPPASPDRVNALLMGGGGREHAIAAALRRSPRLGDLWSTDSTNPGIAELAKPVDTPVDIREVYRLVQFCDRHRVGLVVIGPEEPLAQGFADKLASPTRLVFGPGAEGARLEADKAWSKAFMRAAAIPTADGRAFTDPEAARTYLESRESHQVVKASGLAKGKGVVVPASLAEALAAVDQMMVQRVFGDAGREVVIEERLTGPEVTVFALVDGRNIYLLEPCQDHKRLGDGDTGPNTGGMGAFCPSSLLDAKLMDRVQHEILLPTVDSLKRDGIDFRGVLYIGLILTPAGPKVLEFNVRFGDPECQALLPRLKTDLLEIMLATCRRELHRIDIEWLPGASCCVVLASGGYPEKPRVGVPITGLDEAAAMPDVQIYHAGTARGSGGEILTSGGRVLSVTGTGRDLAEARGRAYAACDVIQFAGKTLRRDIGKSGGAAVGAR